MGSFLTKIKNEIKRINILYFQKVELLRKLIHLIDKSYLNEEILSFYNENISLEFNEDKELEITLIDFKKISVLFKSIKEIINKEKIKENIKEINILLGALEGIREDFYRCKLDYNSLVIGYNYRRNLRFTKFIKNIFKVKIYKEI